MTNNCILVVSLVKLSNCTTDCADCVDEMAAWMESNSLKLNRSKTEAIWFSSLRKVNKLSTKQIRILDTFISPSESVKSLGVFMDRDLSMNSYKSKMLQADFSALRQIRSIKKRLMNR